METTPSTKRKMSLVMRAPLDEEAQTFSMAVRVEVRCEDCNTMVYAYVQGVVFPESPTSCSLLLEAPLGWKIEPTGEGKDTLRDYCPNCAED